MEDREVRERKMGMSENFHQLIALEKNFLQGYRAGYKDAMDAMTNFISKRDEVSDRFQYLIYITNSLDGPWHFRNIEPGLYYLGEITNDDAFAIRNVRTGNSWSFTLSPDILSSEEGYMSAKRLIDSFRDDAVEHYSIPVVMTGTINVQRLSFIFDGIISKGF